MAEFDVLADDAADGVETLEGKAERIDALMAAGAFRQQDRRYHA